MNKNSQDEYDKLSKDYWINKISNFKSEGSSSSLNFGEIRKIERSISLKELEDFQKITGNNVISEFVIFLTVYTFLIKKFFGISDNLIASPLHRDSSQKQDNGMLVFKLTCPENCSFKQLIVNTKEEVQETFKYELINSSVVSDALNEFGLNLQSFLHCSICYDSLNSSYHLHDKSHFHININKSDNELRLQVWFNDQVYTSNAVASYINSFVFLLKGIKKNLELSLIDVDILPELDKKRVLYEFNNTALDYRRNRTIIELFEDQVKKTPDAIAVMSNDVTLSYNELLIKVNRLANYLRNVSGVNPNDLVGVMLDRSEELVISILAILKTGAAYVPLDINYPKERIEMMIEDSGMKVLITEECQNSQLSFFEGKVLILENEASNIENTDVDFLFELSKPQDLVYVIYTSGSTGKPKGVMVNHGGFSNLINWYCNELNLSEDSSVLLIAPVSFDLAQKNIFAPLVTGGKLYLSERLYSDYSAIRSVISDKQINIINAAPSAFYPVLHVDNAYEYNQLKSLRQVVLGGEPIIVKEFLPWLVSGNCNAELINSYGPTECTDVVSYYRLSNQRWKETISIPVGTPIDNTYLYILEESLRPVPLGVIGEIYISGEGVSNGYLNREDLTEEKFLSNPFVPGTKMYKTGDLGRWTEDGNIEYLGRIDHQVKIRGFRIELGEIESCILKQIKIKETVVNCIEEEGEKYLVGYVISEELVDVSELKVQLSKELPEYMIPVLFIQLEKFPLTPSGKLDRKALLRPDEHAIFTDAKYIAPETAIEKKIAEIWSEVLNLPKEKISITSSFFELGGHSLRAVKLSGKISKEFSVSISLREIFLHQNIASQSKLILSGKENLYESISPRPRSINYILSNSQRRLWVLSQFEEGSKAYHMPGVFELRGDLDKQKMEESFVDLIFRHESLRTVFKEDEELGEVRQWIKEAGDLSFTLKYFETDEEEKIAELLEDNTAEAFDLSEGPLLRGILIKRREGEYLFGMTMHHIVSDGWSMGILVRDLLKIYAGKQNETAVDLPELRIQYKDYAVWQEGEISKSDVHKAYWLKQFEGELPVFELPGYQSRPAVKTYNGAVVSGSISKTISSKLKKYSQEKGGTLFMGLLAGVNGILHRYSSQEDIIIGSPIAGREHVDLEDQIGFYVNTLAMRTRFKGTNSFSDLFKKVKEVSLGAYEHQVYPFDALVEDLELKRDMSRSALFDVMIVLQNKEQSRIELEGIEIRAYAQKQTVSKFDLTFNFTELVDGEIHLSIEYNTDLYEEWFISQMSAHVVSFIETVIENPIESISTINYLSALEKKKLLEDFNDTAVDYPRDKTLVDLFEEQVERTPDNVAVVYEGTELTYRELNDCSNQLGNYLRSRYSIQPDDLLGIKLERSEWMIITILGVLKSGGAYVPIDPDFPQDRIDYMLEDSNCKVLIDERELEEFRKETGNESDGEKGEKKYSKENLGKITAPNNLAYVIYTSGSTGKPKGVKVFHCSIVNLIQHYSLEKNHRSSMTCNYVFDVSVLEMFSSLLSSGSLFIPLKKTVIDFIEYAEFLYNNSITHAYIHPFHIKNISSQLLSFQSVKIERILIGVESILVKDILPLKNIGIKVINGYGPTEATVYCTDFNVHEIKVGRSKYLPIGSPINNTQLYMLDRWMQALPIGVVGDIYIGGEGLARGYLNRPDLTEEKFVNHPFVEGERLYKTGDLGRWMADGNIEFVGRKDDQIKIRGYRIELGEIESTLQEMEGVYQAIVLAKDMSSYQGSQELVAYLVMEGGLELRTIKERLQSKLPAYMVPAYFVELESIPLTPNGKIDKKALPNPDGAGLELQYVAPRNEIEHRLAEIWSDVLSIPKDKISVTSNFFELGGHSLKAVLVIAKINKELGIKFTIEEVFSLRKISSLGIEIARREWALRKVDKSIAIKV